MNRNSARKINHWLLGMPILGLMVLGLVPASAAETNAAPGEEAAQITSAAVQNYSSLADLITMICNDALERFQGFYGPSVVTVEPFATISPFDNNRQSELGMTLADQMTAVINNDTLANKRSDDDGSIPQSMHGVLQEIDGYLRIHISGINSAGERTSYVVTVEMSDPIYRGLHTYL